MRVSVSNASSQRTFNTVVEFHEFGAHLPPARASAPPPRPHMCLRSCLRECVRTSDKQTPAILPAGEIKFPLLRSGVSTDPIGLPREQESEGKRRSCGYMYRVSGSVVLLRRNLEVSFSEWLRVKNVAYTSGTTRMFRM